MGRIWGLSDGGLLVGELGELGELLAFRSRLIYNLFPPGVGFVPPVETQRAASPGWRCC